MIPDDVMLLLNNLTIFTLAILVGFAVISKVPATLHTPLMSGANSIHGIVLVGAMLIAVRLPAASTVLLVGPQHDADRPPRPEIQLLHDPQRFPGHDAPSAIVGRTRADVPRIEVAADDDDLVRPLAAADLADHVRRFHVAFHVRVHAEVHDDGTAAFGHPLQPIGIFGGDCGGGDLR